MPPSRLAIAPSHRGIGPIDDYADDMAVTGAPIAHHIRDLAVRTAELAIEEEADLVLTGNGGDDVANDRWILAELVRHGHGRAWFDAVRTMGSGSVSIGALWAVSSIGQALPAALKQRIMLGGRGSSTDLLSHRLRDVARDDHPSADATPSSHPLTRDLHNGRSLTVLEYEEAMLAHRGIEVSHPFLDRMLVEFVASLPLDVRPVHPGNKALLRSAFASDLPEAVVGRRDKVVGNQYIETVALSQGPQFIARYPTVSEAARPFLDAAAYRHMVSDTEGDPSSHHDLWPAWSLMLWLDSIASATVQDPQAS